MLRLALPLVLLASVALAGLLAGGAPPRADFVMVNRGEVSTLDPVQMSWLQDFRAASLLSEGLTRWDVFSESFDPVPGVAESWTISDDACAYTFRLREDARWSDASPVTAHDFVYAWRRLILPDGGGDYAALLSCVRGVREFVEWRSRQLAAYAAASTRDSARAAALWEETVRAFDERVGVHAPDDRTLVVELERPTPYFLDLTSFGPLAPVHRATLERHESIDPRTALRRTDPSWTRPGTLVSNGPFRLTEWRFKRHMRFERSEHYWDRQRVNVRSVAIPSIADGNAQVLAFRSGAVDWTSDVTPFYRGEIFAAKQAFHAAHAPEVARLRAAGLDPVAIDRALPRDPRAHVHAFPSFGTYFYNFNCRPRLGDGTPNPFADARVRRAFARTIDRESVARDILRGGERPTRTLIPPGSIGGYASPPGLEPDVEIARRELAEAGFPGGAGFPAIEILVNSEGNHALIAQAVARDWGSRLGVRARVIVKETRAFREDVKGGRFMVSRATWFGDYGDPTTFLDLNRTGNGNNDRGYSSPAYDELLAEAERAADPAERLAILARAEALLVEHELPFAPIYQYVQQYLFDPHRVGGISPHPRQAQDLSRVDILGDGVGADVAPAMRPGRAGGSLAPPAPPAPHGTTP
ncbi:MAG: peptide ABC transporter substrate-binding protein [Planctomycetota bacterium]|nr:peptide ABC transporter substrate-binding protein [Planctomycetota bacterium]